MTASIRARQREGRFPVIAEVKHRSSKEGDLLRGRDPVDYARLLATQPVAGISVVTEPVHFGGSMEVLRAVAAAVGVPVLHKDFVTSREQIDVSREMGSAAILLIAEHLTDDQLRDLAAHALAVGLEPLIEAHTADEARRVAAVDTPLVGINNRDITVFEVDDTDVARTQELAGLYPPGRLVLSESSLTGSEDVRRAALAGADGVLVGTALLKADDAAMCLRSLIGVGWPA
nr:indole-3-glycerol-phosphate synthase [Tessaracoccus sp. MC1756]